MGTYRTAQLARIAGVHPNTVRLYEKLGFIPAAQRQPNGYRVFTELHLRQMLLARTALQIELLQRGLRKQIVCVVRLSAAGRYDEALALVQGYHDGIEAERRNAEEAVRIAQGILAQPGEASQVSLRRSEAAQELGLTAETLRNWERNGLVSSVRGEGGYRVYAPQELRTLKVIRALRCAGYSLEAILRMLQQLSSDPGASMREALDTPRADDDIVTVCDRLISSLEQARRNARTVVEMLQGLRADYGSTGAQSHEPVSADRKGEGLPA
ncbi:MAG: MerR family transcriptional regulator [Coriobacteriales bacterium]